MKIKKILITFSILVFFSLIVESICPKIVIYGTPNIKAKVQVVMDFYDKYYDGDVSLWYVNSLWDYESYEENSNNVTELPINSEKGYILKIPDGLSQYLTVLGRANEFYYTSMWKEEICPKK